MQRLVNAIDKATRAGVYTLEETAQILQALDQVGSIVGQYQQAKDAAKDAPVVAETLSPKPAPELVKLEKAEE